MARGLEDPGRARETARAVGVAPRLAAVRRARPAPYPYSFFRLVRIWVLVDVVFIIIPKDSIASLPLLSASRLVALSKLTPSSPRSRRGLRKQPWRLLLVAAYSSLPGLSALALEIRFLS